MEENKSLYTYRKGTFVPNKLRIKDELIFLTRGRCVMSYLKGEDTIGLSKKEMSNKDIITYHHIIKDSSDGEKTYYNGVPILRSYHSFLNTLEEHDPKIYAYLNEAFLYYKEAIDMDNMFEFMYGRNAIKKALKDVEELDDSNIKFHLIREENLNGKFLSIEHAAEVRKALIIYRDEVIPSIKRLKEAYDRCEIYQKFTKTLKKRRQEKIRRELIIKEYYRCKRKQNKNSS